MTYRPPEENKKAKLLSLIFAAAAVTLFVVSTQVTRYPFAYQLAGVITAIIAVEIYLKYVFSEYTYEAAKDDLKVYRVTGSKSVCVCSLAFSESLCTLVPSAAYEKDKAAYPKTKLAVNACKNISPTRLTYYFFSFNGKNAFLKFEPDAMFASYADERIRAAMKHKEDEDDG